MTELSDNPDREELRAMYESAEECPSECWHNYGDVNPAPHGGDWVFYEGGEWEYTSTFCAADVGIDMSDYPERDDVEVQYISMMQVQWRDIVTENGEWTDAARRTVESLHNAHDTPAGAVVDGTLTWFVVAFAQERAEGYPYRDPIHTGDYADVLDSVGVEPCPGEL